MLTEGRPRLSRGRRRRSGSAAAVADALGGSRGDVESVATRERARRAASGRRRRREESKLTRRDDGEGSGGEEKGTLEGAGGGGFWSVTDEMDLVGGWSARAEWAGIGFLSRLGSRDKMGLLWTALCKLHFFLFQTTLKCMILRT